MNSKLREAIRKAYVSKANRNGPADLVRADRDAGPRIHRDENTWTVATPEEFREGMTDVARRQRHANEYDDAAHHAVNDHRYNRPTGRTRKFDELQQKLAERIRDAKTQKERRQAESDYREAYGESARRRNPVGIRMEKRRVRE